MLRSHTWNKLDEFKQRSDGARTDEQTNDWSIGNGWEFILICLIVDNLDFLWKLNSENLMKALSMTEE